MLALAVAAMPLAAADAMNVATFLEKGEPLMKKGAFALFSSDFKLLKREIEQASAQLRTERLAAEKAGRKPSYCPPAKSGLSPEEIMAGMRAVPVTQRQRADVKDGLRIALVRKFPCGG
ncbi:hypothetical protein E2493_06560 [Sphingomonas parva]|uniref:Uncharacterized protein n=1 Tax=Sphingomonas parva TaxID=2555898 RepID=A0A4Y8ZT37_9SPHN|nr:hypothetical protein [Sphingomonas parva]TFI59180.1 hypothetical protein E2493_06560 [Sphingomonas parva]